MHPMIKRPSIRRSPLGNHRRHAAAILATAAAFMSISAAEASAYFPSTGAGAGAGPVAKLAQPGSVKASAEGTSVVIGWAGVSAPGSGVVDYYVTRDGGQPAGNCPTAAAPSTQTTCTDSGLSAGSHTYTVTAVWRSWSASSAAVEAQIAKPQSQTIAFTSTAPTKASVAGTAYKVTASASSGLPVALTIDTTAKGICSISGSTVTFLAPGACVIDANQAGNGSYEAAAQKQQSFTVGKGAQTIAFTTTPPQEPLVAGAGYAVAATASSGLTVALTVDSTAKSVCSLAGSTISFSKVGTCVIDANQAGNSSYEAAPQAQQSFTVGLPLSIASAESAGLGRYALKGAGMPEQEVSVSVCKVNQFPCPSNQLAQTLSAVVSPSGEWLTGSISLSTKKTYYAQASDPELGATSSVFKFATS